MVDQLTGIANRRNFDARLNLEWNRSRRDKSPLAILLIDLDNFKNYNDTYGHLQGDTALRMLAKIIDDSIKRSTDLAARWGGEEFIVLLPDIDKVGAMEVAERIRSNIENCQIPCTDGSTTSLTASIGGTNIIPTGENLIQEFIDGADQALYIAKNSGKNRVCMGA
jgi:two-component system chemotaxis family response regulator WspR